MSAVCKERRGAINGHQEVSQDGKPRSLSIASAGVTTSGEFANLMSSLMGDLMEGAIDAGVANAMANLGGKLLKVKELEMKYGTRDAAGSRELRLAGVGA